MSRGGSRTSSIALVEIGDGVETKPVDPDGQPEVERIEDCLVDRRVLEVEVWLVGEEAMPVVGVGHRIPGPVRGLGVLEDDAGVLVELGVVGPDVEVTLGAARRRLASALEPGC